MIALVLAALALQDGFTQPDPEGHPGLYRWTDTCNVYVLKDGDAALLIDLGDGSVLDRLGAIGVKKVEWVLFTHHHREQCQGAPRLAKWNAKIAGPAAERGLFENPASFRKMKVRLGDAHTIHGASYVRPPVHPVKLDRAFQRMDTFTWRGREIRCLDTRGHSPGGMSYFLPRGDGWSGFTGGLIHDGANMSTWFDSEWDYGFAKGIHALGNSVGLVQGFRSANLFPSHGPVIRNPAEQLAEYLRKIRALEKLYVRGYDVGTFSNSVQDKVSRPTAVPHIWRVLPHLYKFRGPRFGANFSLIISDGGRGLAVDCGLFNKEFLDRSIGLMKERLGLKSIDAVVITHMHGDHFLQAPHLREKYGTKIWAIDRMGPVCEHPERFDYAAPIQAYGHGIDGVKFDRLFKDGESFEWEGYTFTVDWMPGQTEFALALQGMIDGKKVVFTGDNLFGDPEDPTHTAHEAMVAHNSAILEEGYIYGAEYLSRLKPDLIMGSHCFVMDKPAGLIERYRRWAYAMRDAFQGMSPDEDYRYWFDPFWVRAEPYRVEIKAGGETKIDLHVRNFRKREQKHRIEIHPGPGLAADPPVVEGVRAADSRGPTVFTLRAKADAKPGVRIVAFDVTLDGRRYGQRFDMIVEIKK